MAKPDESLEDLLEAELEKGFFSAYFVECGYLHQTRSQYQKARGNYEPTTTVFDLASLTKAIVTAPLVHQVIDQRKLNYASPLSEWASQLSLPKAILQLSTEELLAHVSGLPAWWNFWMGRLDSAQDFSRAGVLSHIEQVMGRIPFRGDKTELYSDIGYIVLGYALEKELNRDLAVQFREFLDQLTLPSQLLLGFPSQLNLATNQYVPTGYCRIRERELRGEVHDENCAAFLGISGHAGLFGSGEALVQFLKSYWRHPLGQAYFQQNESVRLTSSRESLLGCRRGSGQSAQTFVKGQSLGHLGFTGTAFWIEQKTGKYAVFLSNRVVSGRVSPRITEVRRQVFQYLDECLA